MGKQGAEKERLVPSIQYLFSGSNILREPKLGLGSTLLFCGQENLPFLCPDSYIQTGLHVDQTCG